MNDHLIEAQRRIEAAYDVAGGQPPEVYAVCAAQLAVAGSVCALVGEMRAQRDWQAERELRA
jgi:hypothetical protein